MFYRNSGPFDGNRLDSGGGGGEDGDERAGGEALDNDTDGYLRPNFSPAAQKTRQDTTILFIGAKWTTLQITLSVMPSIISFVKIEGIIDPSEHL